MSTELIFRVPVRYFWRLPAMFVIVFSPMIVSSVIKDASPPKAAAKLFVLALVAGCSLFGAAYLFTVRVTDEGVFDRRGKGFRWSEIERTAAPTTFPNLGGFLLQSTHKSSLHIPMAIAQDPAFQKAVLAHVPLTHPLAHALDATNAGKSAA